MVEHHRIFLGYYFFHLVGLHRNLRDRFRDHEWFDYTTEFWEKYDQKAFDPDYSSEPLDFVLPMVERVFAQPKR
jgi:predicted HD phosphohydrolase